MTASPLLLPVEVLLLSTKKLGFAIFCMSLLCLLASAEHTPFQSPSTTKLFGVAHRNFKVNILADNNISLSTRIHSLSSPSLLLTAIQDLRGGSDSIYGEEQDEKNRNKKGKQEGENDETTTPHLEKDDDDDDVNEEDYDEADDALLQESNILLDDEVEDVFEDLAEIEEEDEEEEEENFQIEQEEIFAEDEDLFEDVQEETASLDAIDQEEEEDDDEEEEEELTTQVLEKATSITTTTDDEGSSAFVDRMELADAYDDEEEEDEDEAELATVSAASAIEVDSSLEETAVRSFVEDEPASAPTIITEEMREVLIRNLHFRKADVDVLRPDIAAMVVANRLRKPIEGMPPNWYVAGASPKAISIRKALAKATVSAVAIGGIIILGTRADEMGFLDDLGEKLQKIPGIVAAIPAALMRGPSSSSLETCEIAAPVEEEKETKEEENHPHSVKPGSTEPPSYEKDLDKSVLDKFLTKIENVVKGFFRITI